MSNITTERIETVTSMEVAEMVGKEHKGLLRDIRRYCEQLAESNLALGDFFTESTYLDANNQSRPCYLVTKKGCEFIAHKLTGVKGTEFTAKYINRFHELEEKHMSNEIIPNMTGLIATLESEILGIKNELNQITKVITNKVDTGFGAMKNVKLTYLECLSDSNSNETYKKRYEKIHNLVSEIATCGNYATETKVFFKIYKLMKEKCGIDVDKCKENYIFQNPYKENVSTFAAIINSPIVYDVFLSIANEMKCYLH